MHRDVGDARRETKKGQKEREAYKMHKLMQSLHSSRAENRPYPSQKKERRTDEENKAKSQVHQSSRRISL